MNRVRRGAFSPTTMPDLLRRASCLLADTFAEHAASEVVYSRSAQTSRFGATVGRTQFQSDDGNGGITEWQSVDFIVKAEFLKLDGLPFTPRRGDRITFCGSVYEVLAPIDGPAYRKCDAFGYAIRIHTKRIGDA